MGRGKSEPADEEANRIVCGFRYGVEERDIFGSDRFDIVHEASDQESQKREEEWRRKKNVCQGKAQKTEHNTIEQKGQFFYFSSGKRSVSFSGMVYIELCVCDLINDIISCRDAPGKEESECALAKSPESWKCRNKITV